MSTSLKFSPKYKRFFNHVVHGSHTMDVLEGVTAAGKTTMGIFAFVCKVYKSSSTKPSIISGLDTGTVEKNIINSDLGILDLFGEIVDYYGNGTSGNKQPHLVIHSPAGDKIVYIFGYADKVKWKKNLGAQYYAVYIDEVNIADIDYVRETLMRCDYAMMTLNPDDPALPVYSEYINCCRPLPEFRKDAPQEINAMLEAVPEKPGFIHWFFNFRDNRGLSEAKRNQIIQNVPKGTKLYKNKILGLRGRATGLVFSTFDRNKHIMKREAAEAFRRSEMLTAANEMPEWFDYFTAGLDTAYSSKSPDTIAMTFAGITNRGRYVLLDVKVYNNAEMQVPIAPSDTVINFIDFLERNRKTWGFARQTFIDSADQATITEFTKYKRIHPECLYHFNPAYKKITNIDRINLQLGWMATGYWFVLDDCTEYINELELYSWLEDKDNTPEDGHDHLIQSAQYGWIPYKAKIGERNGV